MATPLLIIAGQDPLKGLSGHASFTRAHAHAAVRAGFEPHLFCPAAPLGTVETPYGYVHRSGLSRPRQWMEVEGAGFRKSFLFIDGPKIGRAIVKFVKQRGGPRGPYALLSVSSWGYAGVVAADMLRRAGYSAVTLNSVYTTIRHELDAKVRGLGSRPSLRERARFQGEQVWLRMAITALERRAYLESSAIAVNYESVRKLFLDEYGPGAPIVTLPYGTEASFLQEPLGERPPPPPELEALAPADAPLIVSVSRHDPRKGMDVLVRALGELKRQGARFRACLTSGGELFKRHRALARELDLSATTVLTGWIPDPFPYLRHADIYVLPSTQEGSGSLALLEAFQAGAPVVASDVDGIPEDVTDGDNGLLVPPGQPAALAAAIARLIADADLRRRLARRSRETFSERFSPGAFAAGLRQAWRELGVA